eukprot:157665_1
MYSIIALIFALLLTVSSSEQNPNMNPSDNQGPGTTSFPHSPHGQSTKPTPEELDCSDEQNPENWRMEFVGTTTQFRLNNPCNDKFIKIRMESITLFNNGQPTNTKETSFTSSSWQWDNGENGESDCYELEQNDICCLDEPEHPDCVPSDALINSFTANQLTEIPASFSLDTAFLRREHKRTKTRFVGGNETEYEEIVNRGVLKFGFSLFGWKWQSEGDELEIMMVVMTNQRGTFKVDQGDDGEIKLEG